MRHRQPCVDDTQSTLTTSASRGGDGVGRGISGSSITSTTIVGHNGFMFDASSPWRRLRRRRMIVWPLYVIAGFLFLLMMGWLVWHSIQLWRIQPKHKSIIRGEPPRSQSDVAAAAAAAGSARDKKMQAKLEKIRLLERKMMESRLRGGRTYKTGGRNWCTIPQLQPGSLYPITHSGCRLEMSDDEEFHNISHCAFQRLRIDPAKVTSTAYGGEALENVTGQTDAMETLEYQQGAFVSYGATSHDPDLFSSEENHYYISDVVHNMDVVETKSTDSWDTLCPSTHTTNANATLFIQRYEYANWYHTLTDIWNTWEVYRQLHTAASVLAQVVFLDAHPSGMLDDVWSTLFGTVHRINALIRPRTHSDKYDTDRRLKTTTCFTSAYMIPAGYVSRIGQVQECKDPTVMDEFVDFVLAKYKLQSVRKIAGKVSIIDRRDVVAAHPRSHFRNQNDTRGREIDNLQEVRSWIQQYCPSVTSVHILPLHNMTFYEQLKAVRESQVLIGNHGAGLTHLVFLDDDAHVIEFQWNGRDVFRLLHRWKGQIQHTTLPTVEGQAISSDYFGRHLLPVLAEIFPDANSPR